VLQSCRAAAANIYYETYAFDQLGEIVGLLDQRGLEEVVRIIVDETNIDLTDDEIVARLAHEYAENIADLLREADAPKAARDTLAKAWWRQIEESDHVGVGCKVLL